MNKQICDHKACKYNAGNPVSSHKGKIHSFQIGGFNN